MRPPTVRFLGGVREIGGNKILVEDGPDRILFDFGPSFDPRREEYYFDFLQPRSTSPVKDLLEFDLIPWLDGLYSPEALGGMEERYTEPSVHAVFVSHAHADHAGYLRYIDPAIPVYTSAGTRKILESNRATNPSLNYGDHPWKTLSPGSAVRVGSIEVVPYPVDHSVPYATGFLVRTGAGSLAYTGDFRRHGPRAALTTRFLSAAAAERPAGLIIEGTRAGPDPRRSLSEEGVRKELDRLLAATPGLALVSCYPRDVDRIRTLHAAAQDAGRTLVVPAKAAFLLQSLQGDDELPVPRLGQDPYLRVYRRSKKRLFKWEQPLLDEAIDAEEVHRRGKELLLLLDLFQFAELNDLRPEPGTPFVRSMSEPFSEEDVNDHVLRNWLEHFDLRLHQMHASGHCSGPELAEVCREVNARAVFPVHTEHPEAFASGPGRFCPPTKGERYRIETGEVER
ncbi:MAG: MBL fold metallo-hydrolase [Thermoplasmata archaeon]|nr:MBL fold metallo-hydrolase [Thermoplasmata archaeon]